MRAQAACPPGTGSPPGPCVHLFALGFTSSVLGLPLRSLIYLFGFGCPRYRFCTWVLGSSSLLFSSLLFSSLLFSCLRLQFPRRPHQMRHPCLSSLLRYRPLKTGNLRLQSPLFSLSPSAKIRRVPARGRVAQLGERVVRNDEVAGSNPVTSTISSFRNTPTSIFSCPRIPRKLFPSL